MRPLDVLVKDARSRSEPFPFRIQGASVTDLLAETIQLAKLVSTEKKDLEALRMDYEFRVKRIEVGHEATMDLINREYVGRAEQMRALNEQVKLLISMNQFEIAQQIMNRLADILADSPLKQALSLRHLD